MIKVLSCLAGKSAQKGLFKSELAIVSCVELTHLRLHNIVFVDRHFLLKTSQHNFLRPTKESEINKKVDLGIS